jgi:hypothetical protein
MGLLRRGDPELAAAIAAATAPKSCGRCGRTFAGSSAYQVAHDQGRCLPDHMTEALLIVVDGVVVLRGSDAAGR